MRSCLPAEPWADSPELFAGTHRRPDSMINTHGGILGIQIQPAIQSQPEEHHMCSPARCSRCGKTTWSGCGMHVDSVMARVAPPQRCTCSPVERPVRRFPWSRS
jgi:hypothetical protein